jgi:hypothetical protein
VEQRLGEELSRLQPSELITVDWQPEHASIHGLVECHPLIQRRSLAGRAGDRQRSLKRHFGVATLDGFRAARASRCDACAPPTCWPMCTTVQPSVRNQLTRLHRYSPGRVHDAG